MIDCENGLSEPRRQLTMDLLGVPLLLRSGNARVPAGDDVAGLRALVAYEIGRLERRRRLVLEARDLAAQAKARQGLPVAAPDAATRRARSNESRAYKRMVWAIETLARLRQGELLGTIIDPETKKPLGGVAPAPPRPPAAGPAPAPAAAPVPPGAGPVPLPDYITGEDREAFILLGETLRQVFLMASSAQPPPPT
jgi:hypothetical protein